MAKRLTPTKTRIAALATVTVIVVLVIAALALTGGSEPAGTTDDTAAVTTTLPERPAALDVAGTAVPGLTPRCDDAGACTLVSDGDLPVIDAVVSQTVNTNEPGASLSVVAVGDTFAEALAVDGTSVTASSPGTWDVTVLSGRGGWSFRLNVTDPTRPRADQKTHADDSDIDGSELDAETDQGPGSDR